MPQLEPAPAPAASPPPDLEATRAFWKIYAPLRESLNARLLSFSAEIPEFAGALKALRPEQLAKQQEASAAAQEQALVHGNWMPLYEQLTQQGRMYAELGVPFASWFELLSWFRQEMRTVLSDLAQKDLSLALLAGDGLTRYVDASLARLGEAYLGAKETLIQRHQEAIRELSTPVLQLRERLLLIPVVGMVDTLRARQLTEALLRAIRERRARAVVMDITGVPIVDSRVANHLVQACEAARLMGAHVIITGISSSIAQALVTIGAELRGVPTLGDLQTGLEEAERVLAGFVPSDPAAMAQPIALATGGK